MFTMSGSSQKGLRVCDLQGKCKTQTKTGIV